MSSGTRPIAEEPSDLFVDTGLPNSNRRLTDKILAAFNHAYSIGERDLAHNLRDILLRAEEEGHRRLPRRRPGQARESADLWVEFVEARDRYREAVETPDIDHETKMRLLKEMRDSYRRWSVG